MMRHTVFPVCYNYYCHKEITSMQLGGYSFIINFLLTIKIAIHTCRCGGENSSDKKLFPNRESKRANYYDYPLFLPDSGREGVELVVV